ncbi:hypothetical protein G6669_04960 [Polynucleobacter paneuropaeus]|nr:hypothetical protein [Polynucleobacter paneuropaeus]QWD39933.1 hypothetical protein G6669_04960 [Polynucleobacter paneuropaeus]
MAKKGYVLRSDIEHAIEEELASKGSLKANANSRSCISDYKKQVPNQSREILILNEGDRELEQYRCQELGEWLYRRQGSLKEFRTPVCPCSISFDLSITEGIGIADGSIALNPEEADNPKYLINTLLQQNIANEKEIADLKKRLNEFEEKAAKTKEKQRAAGKTGGRGRTNW